MDTMQVWDEQARLNLRWRQEKLQQLLELERNWPRQAEVAKIGVWVEKKQQMLNDLDELMRDESPRNRDQALKTARPTQAEPAEIRQAVENLKELIQTILDLHQKNVEALKMDKEKTGLVLARIQQELSLLKAHRENPFQARRVDMVG